MSEWLTWKLAEQRNDQKCCVKILYKTLYFVVGTHIFYLSSLDILFMR